MTPPPPHPGATEHADWASCRILLLTPLMAAGTLGLFLYDLGNGDYAYAQTRAFTTLVAFQWFHLLNARSFYLSIFEIGPFSNRWLAISLVAAILLQLAAVYTGVGQLVFGTVPLTGVDWVVCIGLASSILVADETLKALGLHGAPPRTLAAGREKRP